MKKITLLVALFFFALQGNAQIANGSVAPNFTATDINGNVWTLSDILASGKTVIMDISATWCGPCWGYHNNHTLEDVYTAYGPDGSDEVVVLFIEGDGTTNGDDLLGLTAESQGNWVEGSPYPIIDSATIANLYQITYFPTIFRICPDGIVNEISTGGISTIRSGINGNCGTLTGVQNHVHALENVNGFCTANGAPVAKLKNYGENSLTAANIDLLENGTVVSSKDYVGTIARFATKSISFDEVALTPGADYTFKINSVSGGSLFSTTHDTADMGIYVAAPIENDVTVKVYTDNYPTEITWKIKNSANVVVASGGPYVGSANGGGADANTTKIHNITLPDNDCYSVQLSDAFGDGWGLGNTTHGMEFFVNDASVFFISGDDFSNTLTRTGVLTNVEALGVGENQIKKFGVYPNPTNGIFQINTESPVKLTVVDMLGKTIYQSENITSESLIDLSGFQKGVYLAKIVSENGLSTEKVILK